MSESASVVRFTRRTQRELTAVDRPLRLPHGEFDGGGARFLGEPVPELLPDSAAALWAACDGGRAFGSFAPAEAEWIARWHAAGLVVAAPAPRTAPAGSPVCLSPHPDDATLAVGALLARSGGRVVNVFSQETWTRRPYYRERPALASRLLLAEERVACRVLDVRPAFLGHVDAADRAAWGAGFLVEPDAEASAVAAEPDLFARVTADLAAEVAGAPLVLVPLGVGGHVDHVLTRQAALALVHEGVWEPGRVAFYEDMPYALFTEAAQAAGRLERPGGLSGAGRSGGGARPVRVPGSEETALAKQEALWAYRLQVLDAVVRRIDRYGRKAGDDGTAAGVADAADAAHSVSPVGFAERLWVWPEAEAAVRELAADRGDSNGRGGDGPSATTGD
ncbi:PIG-L deacetylase family protein [Streptomyces sp. NPDC058417]|uniref:PIG-L deacetylase family protein n=1 Tax=unclassified Streptomyces TaxID=2593676 RepID=UPI00365037D3